MSTPQIAKAAPVTKLSLGLIMASVFASAFAEPSQLPLLTRDGWEGKPNVVFTLDDSGSMVWQYMPDSLFGATGVASNRYRMGFDPIERNAKTWAKNDFVATIDGDIVAARFRAPAVNKVYYNPDIRYVPWAFSDGSLMANSPPAAAFVEPLDLSKGTADLTGVQTAVSEDWCTSANCTTKTLDYAPATYFQYSGDGTEAQQSNIANYTRVRISDGGPFIRGLGRADCVTLVPVDPATRECTQAEEYQNFANWFSYYRSRMRLAIGATSRAFSQQGDGLRVGYGRINKGSSTVDSQSHKSMVRGVRTFSYSNRDDFFTWPYDQFGNGSTPLRRSMDAVGKYFERSDNRGPWGDTPGSNVNKPHLECRKSYHIIMSDGYWNSAAADTSAARANVDNTAGPSTPITGPGGQSYRYLPVHPYKDGNSSTLADIAMYYWNRDLRPDLDNRVRPDLENPAFWQQLVQFTVGLGVTGSLDPETDLPALTAGTLSWPGVNTNPGKIDDMWHAAVNSHGQFLSASNPDQFAEALGAVLQSISERESAEGGAAVSSITLEANSRKYIPTYQTLKWSGDVQAKLLDQNGLAIADAWKASDAMPAPNMRNIVIAEADGKTTNPFVWTGLSQDQKDEIGPLANDNLIKYIRGDRTNEGTIYRERDADSVLGDMVNSTPLLIGGLLDEQYNFLPDGTPGQGTYRQFLMNKKARDPVLFIGANDGMLHGFREADGVEAFAYIPYAVLPKLALPTQPSYDHKFLVDGPLMEADAFLPTRGGWRNVLLGSTGGGAQSLFALDVTDPENPQLMWEVREGLNGIAGMGYVMAPPSVGMMKNGQWVAVFGNGYESSGDFAKLHIVDLATGVKVKTISTNEAGNNGMGGVRLVKDYDNVVVAAYAGDRKGKMWRFDFGSNDPTQWGLGFGGLPLYTATSGGGAVQSLQGQPEYVDHPKGGQLVLFGTGKLFEESDLAVLTDQSLYGVWDKIPGVQTTSAPQRFQPGDILVQQSFGSSFESGGTEFTQVNTQSVDYEVHRGWKLDLTLESGQRSIYSPQLVRGLVLFNTVAPTGGTGLPCDDSRSTGYNVLVNALTGGSPTKPILDTNADGEINDQDQIVAVYKTAADGMDTVMYGRGSKVSIQRAQGQTTASIAGRGVERSWRQLLTPPNAL